MRLPPDEEDIPLLTDILEGSPAPREAAARLDGAPEQDTPPPPLEAEKEGGKDRQAGPDRAALEQRLCMQINAQLAPLLAQQVKATVAEALQQAAVRLSADLVLNLQPSLEELIRQAVAEEIQNLRPR